MHVKFPVWNGWDCTLSSWIAQGSSEPISIEQACLRIHQANRRAVGSASHRRCKQCKQETGGVYKYQSVARAVLWAHAAHQLLVVRTVSVELICNLLMLQVGLHFWTFIFVDFETHEWCHCYIYFQGCKPTCVLEWDKCALISADLISLVAVRSSCVEVRLFSFHAIHYALLSFIHCHFCVSTNRRVFAGKTSHT